ncbi:mitochondrial calcium uniporter regulator 1 [Crocuta crocuta]
MQGIHSVGEEASRGGKGEDGRWASSYVIRIGFTEKVAFDDILEELSLSAGSLQLERRRDVEQKRGDFASCGNRKLYFDTHALVCLLEENGFTTQQAEITVSALVKITDANMDIVYKDMVTKMQQEITVQQLMSQIANVKKDMIILEKSEFSALRAENEKINLELHRLKQQIMDEVVKVRTDTKLEFNLEKSRVKELYSLNERKLLEMRTEMVALHAQQDRAVTQTDRKIDTEVAGLKTMLESHKLDNIKYLADYGHMTQERSQEFHSCSFRLFCLVGSVMLSGGGQSAGDPAQLHQ